MPLFSPQITPLVLYDGEPGAAVAQTLTANNAYFVGVTLYAPATLTGVRVKFTTGGAGNYDVGIYSDNSGVPGTLLAHAAATITSLATSTAVLTPALIGGNLPLAPGRYWLALWTSNSATDKVSGFNSATTMVASQTGANGANVLPASASTITPANTQFKPFLEGILLGGWS